MIHNHDVAGSVVPLDPILVVNIHSTDGIEPVFGNGEKPVDKD
jgi:hypothetical protein